MEDVNRETIVVAYVAMKTKSGLSIHKDIRKLSMNTIDAFRPIPNQMDQVVKILTRTGFKIVARTAVGVTISGQIRLFESEFKCKFKKKEMMFKDSERLGLKETDRKEYDGKTGKTKKFVPKVVFYVTEPKLMINKKLENLVDSVHITGPAKQCHKADPPRINSNFYFLNVLNHIPILLKVNELHQKNIKGKNIRISMIDSGFVTYGMETLNPINDTELTVDHKIRHVDGVWLESDTRHNGTNYYTDGFSTDCTIKLGTRIPASDTGKIEKVNVVYSSFHPHYLSQNYNIEDIRMPDGVGWDPNVINMDESGHGSAMAANVLALAPECTFSFVKYQRKLDEENWEMIPLAAFMAAVQYQNPDIISCSWTVESCEDQAAVTLEAVAAVASDIVVFFAAGNFWANCDSELTEKNFPISHPNVISIGGAYPKQASFEFIASDYSSSYDSIIWVNPQRHCPDVVGLVGIQSSSGMLIMMPTEPGSSYDDFFSGGDHTTATDGWVVMSGTSAATQQAAGVAALLLQQYPGLAPMSVKNILENSARDIREGQSGTNQYAGEGWDPATGFGLIDGAAAVNYLKINQFSPFIRDTVEDNGTEPLVPKQKDVQELWDSPDIIVRSEPVDDPQDELGQTVKHRSDLCDNVEHGQDNYIYLRVQNRGSLTGDCMATVYLTKTDEVYIQADWIKVDQLKIQNLEPGEFRVAGPILWPAIVVPLEGQYCLITILDSPGVPAPGLTITFPSNVFIEMIRSSNNLAWRKIDVVNVIPDNALSLNFYLERPPRDTENPSQEDNERTDLEININKLPLDAVLVKVIKRLITNNPSPNLVGLEKVNSESKTHTILKFKQPRGDQPAGIGQLQGVTLNPGEETKVMVYYTIPQGTPAGDYPIIAAIKVNGNIVDEHTEDVIVT